MGTPLHEVIQTIGGGPDVGHHFTGALSGVSNPMLPAERFNVALSHDAMRALGTGLGTGGFILFDDRDDPAAIAAGVSRFLGIESCGQCTPCKQDGLALADRLTKIARSEATEDDLEAVDRLVDTVADSARCNLASQQHDVVDSVVSLFLHRFQDHLTEAAPRGGPTVISAILHL